MAGGLWEAERSEERAKELPCIVRYWNPNVGDFVSTNIDDRDCLKLGPPARYKGVWIDAPVGSDFIAADQRLPTDLQLSMSPEVRAEIYTRTGVRAASSPTKLRYELTVLGRLGQYPSNSHVAFIDSTPNRIVVDKVLEARRVQPATQGSPRLDE